MKIRRFLLAIFSFFLSISLYRVALSASHTIVVTNDPAEHKPIDVFDCRNRIYVYTKWLGLAPGEHSVEAYWYRPGNKQQDHTIYEFNAPIPATWLWLELEGGRGSKLFKSLDPEAGFEKFIGRWHVELYLDGEYLSAHNFMVVC